MKRTVLLFAGMGILAMGAAFGVEAAYEGDLGNAEEPALRPYKWVWHGAKSLVYQTGKSFKEGNMKTPVLGTVETGRGLRRGAVELAESTYRGGVFAPVPREKGAYKDLGAANAVIEGDSCLENTGDFLCTWYLFPLLKYNDCKPMEDEYKVGVREERAKAIREAREAARPKEEMTLTERKEAQKHYVPERVNAGNKSATEGQGNLLNLAR